MTTEEVFFDNNAIGEWLGMGASNGRIEFNVSGSDKYILLKDANVGIGTSTPGNALDVYDTGTAIYGTGYFEETFSGSNSWFAYAIRGITEFTGNPNHYSIGTGLNGDARYAQENFGVKGYAAAGDNNIWSIGVYGEASDIYGAPSAQIIGVKGLAGYTAQNYGSLIGVYAESQGYNATDYGIFATGMKQIGQYTIFSDGDTWSSAYWSPSDKKFKKDIKPIANSLDIINKITPHTYYFKTEDFPMHKFSSNVQYGFIAQELETILPSLVKESVYPELRDEKGNVIREKVNFKAVNYDQLIPILTQGIKEQQLMIENMQKEIQLLKQNIELFENNSQLNKEMENDIEMEIIDKSENNNTHAKLYQNTPNPFSKSTKIEFYIPIEFNNALICITDLQGIILKKYNIINQGNGSIMVKQKDLKSGIYLYSLIIDNQVIDTRKMILE